MQTPTRNSSERKEWLERIYILLEKKMKTIQTWVWTQEGRRVGNPRKEMWRYIDGWLGVNSNITLSP